MVSTPIILQTQTNSREQSVRTGLNTTQTVNSISKAIQLGISAQISVERKHITTDIIMASDDESDNHLIVGNISDEESVINNRSEESDENYPLMKYENRNLWSDKDYQILCLRSLIEFLKDNIPFMEELKTRAMDTLSSCTLPTGPTVFPIIRFNEKCEPNFDFHFLPEDSPLGVREVLQIDNEVIVLSKTIYEWMTLSPKP